MAGTGHDVPEEAAAVHNPIEIDDESLEAGASLYAANCAVCHGETGEGDGPGAEGLERKPSDLHAAHVQENSDGALFYIVSHGRPDTPMPAWDNVLSEDERWHLVNFLRTFGE
jgi:mono/diheme cytochrome c family protein